MVRPFAPQGPYAGHWGVDLQAEAGTPVVAVAAGVVTFAGPVAGRLSVTVHHGGGVRTSYSYLSAVTVAAGQAVAAGSHPGGIRGRPRDRGAASVAAGGGRATSTRCAGWSAAWRRRRWRGTSLRLCRPMLRPVRRGILGGTFDPPHLAHLVAGEAAYRELGLDVVTFLPAGRPWQKAGLGVSPAAHRWEMTRRAVAGVGYFEADDREVARDGWTYTADTLATFPDDEELVLILGADAAAGLPTWHVARGRAGQGRGWRSWIAPGWSGRRWRRRWGRCSGCTPRCWGSAAPCCGPGGGPGLSLRFLVPDAVLAYIESAGLYAPA